MGQSTNAMLMYGYDLDTAGEWKVVEAGEWGELSAAWYDEDSDLDSLEQAVKALYDAIPGAPGLDSDWDRQEAVKEHYGVWFEGHCSDSHTMYALVAFEDTARRGYPELIDWRGLDDRRSREGWDVKLARALEVLGITPKQERPAWLLASYADSM